MANAENGSGRLRQRAFLHFAWVKSVRCNKQLANSLCNRLGCTMAEFVGLPIAKLYDATLDLRFHLGFDQHIRLRKRLFAF